MKNKKKVIGNTVFFFALFGLTAYAVLKGKELSELAEVLKSVKPAYYIAGLVMIVVFVCCESYIIYRMLRLLHYNDVPKRNCVKYSFVGFFFSCITPSATGGQPMQLYYMNRDKVDISVGTVILMIVTILYKFVLVFLGALIFLFRHFLVAEYIGKAAFFFYLGMALNVFCVAFMLILVFEPTLASKIVLWLFQKLEKFHILKKKEERLEKLQNSMIEYHKAAAIIQGHRIFIFRMFVVTLIQRLIHFSITYLVYRAMGLSALGFIDVVALQSVISISVDMLPLPGGMGISEGLFLNIFKKIFVGGLLYPAMLLSRGISYYALVLISAVMTGVAHVTIKRKEWREKGMIGFYNASVILTYLGVVSAVFGMSQAFNGNFKIAILCLMISGLTDMYDGTIAKMIKRSEDAKKFGIEIDSLCDLVCFGVYPVVIGYCLGMDQWYARIIYMCYVLGGVIRLAYFNVTEEQRQAHSSSRRKHYQGLPITSVALIIPIVYQLRRFFPEEFPYIYVAMLAVIAFLFVFDFKVFKPDKKCMLAFVVIGALIAVKMFLL